MSFPPDALLIGAEKCGTTTLTDLLDQHPGLTLSKPLGSDFFSRNYGRGLDWYRSLFADDGANTCLDVSLSYTSAPLTKMARNEAQRDLRTIGVPARIHAAKPDARFLYILRDPVTRTYSSYWHAVRYGYKDIGFLNALEATPQFLDTSNYAGQLELYLEWFPISSFRIILFEEMREDPVAEARHCFRFLELDQPDFAPVFERAKNVSFKYNAVGRYIRDLMPTGSAMNSLVNRAQAMIPRRLENFAKRLIATDVPPMDADAATFLEDYFRPHNEKLAALTGMDLSAWRGVRRTP